MRKKLMTVALAVTMAVAMAITTIAPMEEVFASTITANNITFDTAEELPFNTTITEGLSNSDNIRYYKFSLDEASELNIIVTSSSGGNRYFTIYDENRTPVYTDFSYSSTGTSGSFYLTGGNYYMKLQYCSKVSFSVTKASLKESFTETQTANNDSFDDADVITLFTQYKGVLAQNDTEDYYKLNIPAEGKVNINLVNSTNNKIKVVIYDDSNTAVYNKEIGSGGRLDEDATLASGTYYFMVAQSNVGSGTGSYSFKLNYIMSSPIISSVKNSGKRKMTIKWKKVDKAEGYELQYSKHKNFNSGVVKKTFKSTAKSASYSKLTKGKTYYVRIRAYGNVNGTKKYSGWSKKSVVIKK